LEIIESDVVIIGGGPAGCTCALYTSRSNLKTVILDKNPSVGALAITHQIANYPGVPVDISGEKLLTLMREQAVQYGTDYRRAQVFGIDVSEEWKTVYTPEGTFKAKALVLASGAMGRPASFKGEADFLGKGVSYCATCDGAFYKNREVAVIGVNKEAIEEATVLTKFASTVHWITSSDPKPENEEAMELMDNANIKHWSRTRLLEILGDDFYLEIQDHGSIEDRIVNSEIVKISEEHDIQIIATNDAHYLSKNDIEAHDALICVLTGKLISDHKRLRYTGTEYIKSEDEMRSLFTDHLDKNVINSAIENTVKLSNKVEEYKILGTYKMPNFPIPNGYKPIDYLKEITINGLKQILDISNIENFPIAYKERLDYELNVIEQMGFPTYFLVVWDYIRFAREQNIPVGPGRGSAAGSLVAFSLHITNIDPVENGLLFERFLNPERKSMPDIDTDFCIERRGEVIDYVTKKYGEDKVAQIITFNRMTSKAVLKDVARVLDIPYGDADRLAKLIPVVRGKPAKLSSMISKESPNKEFYEKYNNDSKVKKWVDMAIRIEGTNKTFGVHAAGVVIAADSLDNLVPLQRNNDGQIITQYFMEDIESLGLLKMDFLGLRNLTMIEKTINLVEKLIGERLDPDSLPFTDEKTFELLSRGDLEGIFQLESSGMRQIVKDLKPSSLEDISSILALYRPGPLDAGLIPKFINRKHGKESIDFQHHSLEPILSETYGIMVYQEQIMKIAQDLAGYSLGQADLLRRAMGKKKVSEMQRHRTLFVDGAIKNGVTDVIAEQLFDQMVLFAEYCFNKSHSTAYGAVTYQTAYLKAHYPVAYMAALLTVNAGSADKVQRYISNCNSMGINVMPPNINTSGVDFTPKDNSILFGFSAVKNLGDGAIRKIITSRDEDGEFTSLAQFCDRISLSAVNRRGLEALIHSGALDCLEENANRAQLIADLDLTIEWASSRAKDRTSGQGNLFDLSTSTNNESSPTDDYASAPMAKQVNE